MATENLAQYGLVDLQRVFGDSEHVRFDICYATNKNFIHRAVYPSPQCWIQAGTLKKLEGALEEFRDQGFGVVIFDGFRPFKVQEIFWSVVPDPEYLGQPVRDQSGKPIGGSRHSRGAAIDLTLTEPSGQPLPMPSGFDEFSKRAHRDYQDCSSQEGRNRGILESVMESHGFKGLATEWWHFDDLDWEKYPFLDVDF